MSLWETVSSWIYWTSPGKEAIYGPGRSAPDNLTPLSFQAELEKTVVLGNVSYPKFVVLTQGELEKCITSLRPTQTNAQRPSFKVEGVLGELEEIFLQGVTSHLRQVSPPRRAAPAPLGPDTPPQFLRRQALEQEEEASEENEW